MNCDVCGVLGANVSVGIVGWTGWAQGTGAGHPSFEAIARCWDRQGCRDRVEAAGKAWPLVDATHPRIVLEAEPEVLGWW